MFGQVKRPGPGPDSTLLVAKVRRDGMLAWAFLTKQATSGRPRHLLLNPHAAFILPPSPTLPHTSSIFAQVQDYDAILAAAGSETMRASISTLRSCLLGTLLDKHSGYSTQGGTQGSEGLQNASGSETDNALRPGTLVLAFHTLKDAFQ